MDIVAGTEEVETGNEEGTDCPSFMTEAEVHAEDATEDGKSDEAKMAEGVRGKHESFGYIFDGPLHKAFRYL